MRYIGLRVKPINIEENRCWHLLEDYAKAGKNNTEPFMADAEILLTACAVDVSNRLVSFPLDDNGKNNYQKLKKEKIEMFYSRINKKLIQGSETQETLYRRVADKRGNPFPRVYPVNIYDVIGMAENAASEMGTTIRGVVEDLKKEKILKTLS